MITRHENLAPLGLVGSEWSERRAQRRRGDGWMLVAFVMALPLGVLVAGWVFVH